MAADDPWLVTGDDAGRFRFEIITSGTESMNLQATGGDGGLEPRHGLLERQAVRGEHDVGLQRRLVGVIDAGEVLERAGALPATAWTPVLANFTATANTTLITDPGGAGTAKRFCRVRQVP